MITLETLAKEIQKGLNGNAFGIEYKIHSDGGSYNKALYGRISANRKRFTNGLLQVVSSSVVPVQGLIVATQTARLEVSVQLPDKETEDSVIAMHRAILDSYFQSTGVQMLTDESGKNFSVSSAYSLTSTGIMQAASPLGTYITFAANLTYSMVQNGLNSSQFHVTLDGVEIAYTDITIVRTPTMDASTYNGGNGAAKNVSNTTALQFNIQLPATVTENAAQNAIMMFLLDGDMAEIHTLTIAIGENTPRTYSVVFGDTNISLDGIQNAGYTVTFVEAATLTEGT